MDILNIWFSPTFILFGYLLYRWVRFIKKNCEFSRYFQERYPDRYKQMEDEDSDWPFDQKKHKIYYNPRYKAIYFIYTSKEDLGDAKIAHYKKYFKRAVYVLILVAFSAWLSFGIIGFFLSWWFPPPR